MKKIGIVRRIGSALLSTAIFFVSYYGGLFYSVRIFATAGAVITFALMISTSLDFWAEKYLTYGVLVLILTIIFQRIEMHNYVADFLNINFNYTAATAEDIVINNCVWFAIIFFVALVTLAVTAVISYVKNRQA